MDILWIQNIPGLIKGKTCRKPRYKRVQVKNLGFLWSFPKIGLSQWLNAAPRNRFLPSSEFMESSVAPRRTRPLVSTAANWKDGVFTQWNVSKGWNILQFKIMCMYVYIYIFIYLFICNHVYIYIYKDAYIKCFALIYFHISIQYLWVYIYILIYIYKALHSLAHLEIHSLTDLGNALTCAPRKSLTYAPGSPFYT